MAVVKTIELYASSEKSFEDATKNAIKEASKSVKNIKSVWIKEQKASVSGDSISEYRVDVKLSFEVS